MCSPKSQLTARNLGNLCRLVCVCVCVCGGGGGGGQTDVCVCVGGRGGGEEVL